jgi:hypothetical protein
MHTVGEDLEEPVEDAVPFLGVDLLRQFHRPLHVGEQHSDLFALAPSTSSGHASRAAREVRILSARCLGV